jgi:hypothetical protein
VPTHETGCIEGTSGAPKPVFDDRAASQTLVTLIKIAQLERKAVCKLSLTSTDIQALEKRPSPWRIAWKAAGVVSEPPGWISALKSASAFWRCASVLFVGGIDHDPEDDEGGDHIPEPTQLPVLDARKSPGLRNQLLQLHQHTRSAKSNASEIALAQ